jgi:hypothetical protein
MHAVSLGFPENQTMAVDYSAGPVDPSELVAAGFLVVMRYLAPLPNGKVITIAERQALHAAGRGVGLVWEWYASRCLEGAAAGQQDGTDARLQAAALGFPASWPLLGAVDMNPTAAQRPVIAAYLEAGGLYPYGNAAMIAYMEARGTAGHSWLMDWGGGTYGDYHIHQTGGQVTIGGVQCDVNVVANPDCIWFPPGVVPVVTPPSAVPTLAPKEDDMLTFTNPRTGKHYRCFPDGSVYVFNADGSPGGPWLGGLNNHPDWKAGGGMVNGDPFIFGETPDDGYVITTRDAAGNFHPYAFPPSGILAK